MAATTAAVFVSQPQAYADRLIPMLTAKGFSTRHYPAFTIEFIQATPPINNPNFVIVTSPQAVNAAIKAGIALPKNARYFAVGQRSAQALNAADINDVITADNAGSEDLLQHPSFKQLESQYGWLLTGEGGRGLLDKELSTRQLAFERVETYRRRARNQANELSQQLSPPPELAIATSTETLDNLVAISDADSLAALAQCHWLVSSPRIAKSLQKYWPDIGFTVTKGAHADALVAACNSWIKEH